MWQDLLLTLHKPSFSHCESSFSLPVGLQYLNVLIGTNTALVLLEALN